jgi:hypothetical protein
MGHGADYFGLVILVVPDADLAVVTIREVVERHAGGTCLHRIQTPGPIVYDRAMPDASAAVRDVLQSLIDEGPEIGLQVAAYLDG